MVTLYVQVSAVSVRDKEVSGGALHAQTELNQSIQSPSGLPSPAMLSPAVHRSKKERYTGSHNTSASCHGGVTPSNTASATPKQRTDEVVEGAARGAVQAHVEAL